MYPYVVHVERKKIQPLDVGIIDARGRSSHIRAFNAFKVNIKIDLNYDESSGRYSELETFYCNDKETAESIAAKFAQECPGQAVYVLKLEAVVQSAATPPVVSTYSEKGLIPR